MPCKSQTAHAASAARQERRCHDLAWECGLQPKHRTHVRMLGRASSGKIARAVRGERQREQEPSAERGTRSAGQSSPARTTKEGESRGAKAASWTKLPISARSAEDCSSAYVAEQTVFCERDDDSRYLTHTHTETLQMQQLPCASTITQSINSSTNSKSQELDNNNSNTHSSEQQTTSRTTSRTASRTTDKPQTNQLQHE